MKYLKQRLPLTFDKSGAALFINREFGDDIERLVTTTITDTVTITPADLTAINAAIAALQTSNAAILLSMADLEARVEKLEKAYHS